MFAYTNIQTYINTYKHTYVHAYMHTYKHTRHENLKIVNIKINRMGKSKYEES